MRAQPEGQQRIVAAGQVELVGALEAQRVAVARDVQQGHLHAALEAHPADLQVFQHVALEHRQGRVVAQHLVHARLEQG